jgi:hypothetical protein
VKLSELIDSKIERLKENSARSRRATAEVFATAVELSQDHQSLLQEISLPVPSIRSHFWTVSALKREFTTFKTAQKHFKHLYGIKSSSWIALEERVNIVEISLVHLGVRQRANQFSGISALASSKELESHTVEQTQL